MSSLRSSSRTFATKRRIRTSRRPSSKSNKEIQRRRLFPEFVAADVTIVERKLEDIERPSLRGRDQPYEVHPVALDVFKAGRHGCRTMHPAHVYDAVLKRSVEGLDGVILDKDLLETVTNAVEGIDADTVTRSQLQNFLRTALTLCPSLRTSAKPSTSRNS
jgi:hypothetical protein